MPRRAAAARAGCAGGAACGNSRAVSVHSAARRATRAAAGSGRVGQRRRASAPRSARQSRNASTTARSKPAAWTIARQRSLRKLLQEDVADDAEARDHEAEPRADGSQREAEAVAAQESGHEAGTESTGGSDQAVDHQRPADRRQIARAVRAEPGDQRLDGADRGAGEQSTGDSRSHGP